MMMMMMVLSNKYNADANGTHVNVPRAQSTIVLYTERDMQC